MNKDRIVYLDYLRVFATIAVIILHVASINWYVCDVHGVEWKILNFFDSITRWSVPVFVMISGSLFLKKDDIPLKTIFSKYVLKMVWVYVVWSFIYFLFSGKGVIYQLIELTKTNRVNSLISIINGYYHMWFILMITGLYICIPIIKQIIKNKKITYYFLLVSLTFFILIPSVICLIKDSGFERLILIVNALASTIKGMQMSFVMNFVFYFVLGYVVSQVHFEKKYRNSIYILGAIGFILTIALSQIVSVNANQAVGTYYGNSQINVFFEALAIFELFKNFKLENKKINQIIFFFSKISFGVYLVHALIIECCSKLGITTSIYSPILSVPIISLTVFVCSCLVSVLLHKIPVIKKYIV